MIESLFSRRAVFLDTSAFLAIHSTRDVNYTVARRIQINLIRAGWHFVTSYFVLAELHALAIARVHPVFALELLERIDQSRLSIIVADDDDWTQALTILRRYRDKDFSMTDALSFAVMDRLAIPLAFTFDHHFRQYGLTVADEHII